MKVLRVLERPNGITSHSYNLNFVLKVVFHSSPVATQIWWYPLHRSILEKTLDPTIMSNISSNHRIGKRYLIVMWLIACPHTSSNCRLSWAWQGEPNTRTHALVNWASLQQIFNLLLKDARLLRVYVIMGEIQKAWSWKQVHMMLNVTYGGNSIGNSGGMTSANSYRRGKTSFRDNTDVSSETGVCTRANSSPNLVQ